MSHLNRVELSGFKSFRNAVVRLRPGLNVLIGPNGSGKSNFVGAFSFLRRVVDGDLEQVVNEAGGPDRLLHHGRKVTHRIKLGFWVGDNSYGLALIPAKDRLLCSEEVGYRFDLNPEWTASVSRGSRSRTSRRG